MKLLIDQYFPVVLFIVLYNVVLTLKSVDEILRCGHSNESYRAILSCGTVIMLNKVALTFESLDEILKRDHSNEIMISTLLWCCLLCFTRWF